MIVLIGHAMRSSPEFKLQAAIIALGALVAMAGNILFLLKLFPIPDLDTTPISLTLTMVIYSIGLFRFGILDILEIASESILESMDDVVIVLNNQGYIVFVNKIFDYYFYVQPKSLIGKFAEEAFAQFPELQEVVIRSAVKRLKRDEIKINLPNFGLVFFDVAVSKIRGGRDNRELGRTIVLDDVTERRHAEKRIVDGPTEIPLILVYRASDERIIEVNRTFLLALGYERREVVGRSLSELGIWDPYKRSDFLRALSSEGSVKDYMLEFRSPAGIIAPYKFTATQNEIQGERYIVLLALETGTK
jgi:PAS domain S-box-containing protein